MNASGHFLRPPFPFSQPPPACRPAKPFLLLQPFPTTSQPVEGVLLALASFCPFLMFSPHNTSPTGCPLPPFLRPVFTGLVFRPYTPTPLYESLSFIFFRVRSFVKNPSHGKGFFSGPYLGHGLLARSAGQPHMRLSFFSQFFLKATLLLGAS